MLLNIYLSGLGIFGAYCFCDLFFGKYRKFWRSDILAFSIILIGLTILWPITVPLWLRFEWDKLRSKN